ncbi:restriction endonuclease subunit S [Acetobacterium malicum]|uniref:restriction endonuclease subunit S n=1 Tax=Acetobacterium malicum TaxID=52692 RepID=UPI0035938656
MKDRYIETEIGVLPEDWEVVKINDIANYVGSGTTPRGGADVYKTEGITFIRSQNVYPNKLVLDDVVYIDEATNEKMKRTILQDNDVLLNITGASIGRTAVLPSGFGRSNVNQHVCIIRLKEFFLPIYLSQFINSSFGRKQIDSYNGGSSREGLNFKQVRDILVTAPPLPEQRRIAEILSATDAHLEKLETIIVDIQLLKKGMMQSLFTRGIGHTEFKDTEIGQIPKAWGVKQFKDIAEILMGQSPSGDSYNNDSIGIALLNGPTEFGSVHPTPIQWTTKPTKICTVDDILFCVRGSSTGRMNIMFTNSWTQNPENKINYTHE